MKVITFEEYIAECERNGQAVADFDIHKDNQLGFIREGLFIPIGISEQALNVIKEGKIEEGVRGSSALIPVNLTFAQVQSILDCCKQEAEKISFSGTMIWEVYPGRLIVKVLDVNGDSAIAWTKPINSGKDQSFKIEWSLDIQEYLSMIVEIQEALEKLNRYDDLLYFKIQENSVRIYLENHVKSQMELVWIR